MATTGDVILDRVRALTAQAPFWFAEAHSTEALTFQGSGSSDQVVRLKLRGGPVRGGLAYSEERIDYLEIEVARAIAADYDATRRALLCDATSLVSAIVRDGHADSGIYSVPDAGRTQDISGAPGQSFLTLRLTIPVSYEAQL